MSEKRIQKINPFNRPPRFQKGFKPIKLNIPEPPLEPEEQKRSWLMTVMPMSSMLIMGLFYFLIYSGRSSSGGFGGALFAIPMLAMGLFSAVISLVMYGEQKHQQKVNWIKQIRDYYRLLDKKEARLLAGNWLQKQWLFSKFPSIDSLLRKGQTHTLSLWEKRLGDADFLSVRLGLGEIPTMLESEAPDPDSKSPFIRDAFNIYKKNSKIQDAPVVVDLRQIGSVGVVGAREDVLPFVNHIMTQILTQHSPEDVELRVFASAHYYRAWKWARWLPHASSDHNGGNPDFLAFGLQENARLFGELSKTLDKRLRGLQSNVTEEDDEDMESTESVENIEAYRVCLFDGESNLQNEPSFSILLNDGAAANFLSLIICDSEESVPSECSAVIDISPSGTFEFFMVGEAGYRSKGNAEFVTPAQIDNLAYGLLPITVRGLGQMERIPNAINLLEVYNAKTPMNLDIASRWARLPGENGLLPFPAKIGSQTLSQSRNIHLAENKDGPHGMIAGTTGSGKSELLQTLVSSLALEHHPYFVNFLLIDFKGGSTFSVFQNLPHVVGMVSNLDTISALRALEAIKAENLRRQRFLLKAGVEDINEYHEKLSEYDELPGDWEPLPHLCIIVDEFAQLAHDLPKFLPELVATVRVGRSLGLHLVLATQRPAGVVNDEMRANLNFRICLRVQTIEDSRDLLHRPDAAKLPPTLPGRAYFQIGDSGAPSLFQTARVGVKAKMSTSEEEDTPDDILVLYNREKEIDLLQDRRGDQQKNKDDRESIVHVLTAQLEERYASMCKAYDYQPLPSVLLDELSQGIHLFSQFNAIHDWKYTVSPGHSLISNCESSKEQFGVPIGILDDLQVREQPTLWFEFKNTVIIGNPGSGKTSFLKTLSYSLSYCYSYEKAITYFVSFAGRISDDLIKLPNVGDVIMGEEIERVQRLFRFLAQEIRERKTLLEGEDWMQYTLRNSGKTLPGIIIMIDNFGAMKEQENQPLLEETTRMIQDGPSNGVFFVIAGLRIGDIPHKIMNIIPQRYALSMTDKVDYMNIVGRLDDLGSINLPAGRGYVKVNDRTFPVLVQLVTLEINATQRNTLSDREKEEFVAGEVMKNQFMEQIPERDQMMGLPNRINLLQPFYRIEEIDVPVSLGKFHTILGIDDYELKPFLLDWVSGGLHFLIAGPPRSGRSNLMAAMILGIANQLSSREAWMILVDGTQDSLREYAELPHVIDYVTHEAEMASSIAYICQELNYRLNALKQGEDISNRPKILVFIDDYDLVREAIDQNGSILGSLAPYMRRDGRLGLHVVISGVPQMSNDALIRQIKMRRSGFSLCTVDGVDLIGGRISNSMRNSEFNEGRGYYIERGNLRLVQFLVVDQGYRKKVMKKQKNKPKAQWEFTPSEKLLELAGEKAKESVAISQDPDKYDDFSFSSMFDDSLEDLVNQYRQLSVEAEQIKSGSKR